MASQRKDKAKTNYPPAPRTPEGQENQLISMTVDLAKRQLQDGTASSQVMTHFLKMGSERERLERQKLERELALLQARVKQLESAEKIEAMYAEALNAMKSYSGQRDGDPEYDEYD